MGAHSTADDQLAIHALVGRYSDAVNLTDAELWGGTWADDGVWDLGGGRHMEGRAAVIEFWKRAMAGFESVIQQVTHGSAQVSGDTGTGRWTLFEIARHSGEDQLVVGCYRDRYIRRDGGWLFAERLFTATYRGPAPIGTFHAFPPIR